MRWAEADRERKDVKSRGSDHLANARGLRQIARGRGRTLAQMAFGWTLRDRRVASSLICANSVEQLDGNLAALNRIAFTPDEPAANRRLAVDGGVHPWTRPSNA